MDTPSYAVNVFDTHVTNASLNETLKGKAILELGPGDSISTAIIAATHGARAILVDAGQYACTDIATYRTLAAMLRMNGLSSPNLFDAKTIDQILERCSALYYSNALRSLKQLKTASVDLIFSQAVLQHIRRSEFLETMRECRRILKPGGCCSHVIDLRDHLGGVLNNLRFSEKLWESKLFSTSGFYTNRIQFSQMLELFKQAGFHVDKTEVRRWDQSPISRDKLASDFLIASNDDLRVAGFTVLLR